MSDAGNEHSPLSGIDEHLIHNSPHPVRVMWTPDLQAYERVLFTAHDCVGDLLLLCGLAFYPNLGTAEAWAIVNHRGRHTTVRAHRLLGDDRMDMRVGPFEFEVIEPFREWRLTLDDNAHGLAFDLRWHDTKRAVYRSLAAGVVTNGRVSNGVAGYDGFGNQSGSVTVDGETFTLTRDAFLGMRDHHWGTRDGVGGPALYRGPQWAAPSPWVEFAEWGAWANHILFNIGDARPGSQVLHGREHRLRFDDTRLLVGGEIDMHFPDGGTKTVTFERLGRQTGFLRCAMYGGPNGGTPDGDVWMGMYVGDGVVTGETYDVNDPAVRTRICGLDEHHAVFECEGETTYGLIESYDTLCYEAAVAGRSGLSLLR